MDYPLKHKWTGKQVSWEKTQEKPNASMQEKTGFGVLYHLDLDYSMIILGDYGIATSRVFSIDETENGFEVVTNNSTYLVKEIE